MLNMVRTSRLGLLAEGKGVVRLQLSCLPKHSQAVQQLPTSILAWTVFLCGLNLYYKIANKHTGLCSIHLPTHA